jgi:hypothetical protein
MMVILALGLILAGVLIGGAGLRRAGRLTRRIVGPWRPGVGGLALIALFGGAALGARGAILEGTALAALGVVLAVGARRRPPSPSGPVEADGLARMSDAEARRMLGVSPGAGSEEIEAAYRRLMKRVHPDHGGAAGLAAQLNAARAVLQS